MEARNAGKPISDARGEIAMVVECFRYYAGAPERLLGQTIPVAGGVDMTFREPLGVVGLITPWNFPLVIASWKVAPALAAGNTIVLKPAELTPLTSLELEKIALDAGLAEGVLNVVAGPGSRVRAAPRRAPRRRQGRVHGVDRGGPRDRRRAPPRRSSGSPSSSAASLRTSSSPTPTSTRRRRRRRGPYSATRARTAARARGSSSSDRRSSPFLAAMKGTVEEHGGRRPARRVDPDGSADLRRPARERSPPTSRKTPRSRSAARRPTGRGYWFPPTVLSPVSNNDRAAVEEIFGPVAVRDPVRRRGRGGRDGERHDLRPLRLGLERRRRARPASRAGDRDRGHLDQLEHLGHGSRRPFGGFKQSGVGRELGPSALEHYTEVKNVYYATEEG